MTFLGASVGFLWGQVQLWTGRANNAWGPTRAFNSGASFETNYNNQLAAYNAEVAAYNGMVADRDIWASRANSAWGATRVWPSGESWEAAYARVLEPAAAPSELSVGQTKSNPSGNGTGWSLTTNRTGYWRLSWTATHTFDGGAGRATYQLIAGGGVQDTGTLDTTGSADAKIGLTAMIISGPVECHVLLDSAFQFGSTSGTLVATFVPTQAYPH